MSARLTLLTSLFMGLSFFWMPTICYGQNYEQLIVFIQPEKSTMARIFQPQISEIKRIAAEDSVAFTLVDVVQQGAPPEVTITPLIVFQNHLGRSIYQGRTNTLDRVRNFIRTSRYIPQGKVANTRRRIPVRPIERARIWAPLKVTPVTGTPPENYRHEAFEEEAFQAIQAGIQANSR